MNPPRVREMYTVNSMLDEISKIMEQPEKIILGDQDIINLLFKGHIEKVPTIYNSQWLIHMAYCLKNPSLIRHVVIAHLLQGRNPGIMII